MADRADLPVLAELPDLAEALAALHTADRATARAVALLVRLRTDPVVASTTGVPVDTWLTLVAGATRTDRRMLRASVDTLARLPRVHAAFTAGRLTWAQVRSLVLQLRDTRVPLEAATDAELVTTLDGAPADLDPDDLARQLRWTVWQLAPEAVERQLGEVDERLILQPRLDGSGGTVAGELGAVAFAALETSTRPEAGCTQRSARRAQRLTDLCLRAGAGGADGADDADRQRVRVLLRVDLETLLGTDPRPGQLLTGLAGGAMHVDAVTARRLAGRAQDLRLVITADGAPAGIGRRSRQAPGWLREALLALHTTCTAPGCDRPALTADVDHAQEWTAGGTTDVANLAPLCPHHNRQRSRRRWRIRQRGDGTRRWHHPATGLTATTRPPRPPPPPAGRTAGPSGSGPSPPVP